MTGATTRPKVALITDGRFSGATRGMCVGYVSPEAFVGGPLALVRNGDMIRLDVARRSIELLVDEAELKKRHAALKPAAAGDAGSIRSSPKRSSTEA